MLHKIILHVLKYNINSVLFLFYGLPFSLIFFKDSFMIGGFHL